MTITRFRFDSPMARIAALRAPSCTGETKYGLRGRPLRVTWGLGRKDRRQSSVSFPGQSPCGRPASVLGSEGCAHKGLYGTGSSSRVRSPTKRDTYLRVAWPSRFSASPAVRPSAVTVISRFWSSSADVWELPRLPVPAAVDGDPRRVLSSACSRSRPGDLYYVFPQGYGQIAAPVKKGSLLGDRASSQICAPVFMTRRIAYRPPPAPKF